jgi:alcohol dehydrogenase
LCVVHRASKRNLCFEIGIGPGQSKEDRDDDESMAARPLGRRLAPRKCADAGGAPRQHLGPRRGLHADVLHQTLRRRTLPPYHAPSGGFTPGGNCVGTIEAAGKDVWQLAPGQRVLVSSLFRSSENVADPAQILIGVTSFGPDSEKVQADWPDGTLAEYVLLPASSVVPADGFEDMEATQLAAVSRFVIPYGGLVRGRLAAGETLIVNGATGAYGSAAVFVARAMGAGRVVAAGRNADKLDVLVRRAGKAVVPVVLSGDVQKDAAALRKAAGGGADIGFDMVGGAAEPSSTLAALNSLRRGGRLVLMGSMTVDLPVSYMQLMINSLEIIGNFMYPASAYRSVLALVRSGALDVTTINPKVFPLAELPAAMDAAASAGSLECVVMKP